MSVMMPQKLHLIKRTTTKQLHASSNYSMRHGEVCALGYSFRSLLGYNSFWFASINSRQKHFYRRELSWREAFLLL